MPNLNAESPKIDINYIIKDYIDNIHSDLKCRWNNWEKDLSKNHIYEVIGGILSRQSSLAIQIANCPGIWNEEVAPILLRTMADNHINMAWILVNPSEHSKLFIKHGLGQLKLDLEHRKKNLEELDDDMKERLEYEEQFINAQQYTFLTSVNLGSWSGSNTRKMAEEAGLIDFYNYAYQPFSNCTHSTWAHISKYNTQTSDNPLHRFFRLPRIIEFEPSIYYLVLGGKYLEKSICAFDKAYPLNDIQESAYDRLLSKLDELN